MPYITSVERIGFEDGLKEGRQEGRQETGKLLLQRLLVGKFGTLPTHLSNTVEALDAETTESLIVAMLNFSAIDDLEAWLTTHSSV